MADKKIKSIIVALAVLCLGFGAFLFYTSNFSQKGPVESVHREEKGNKPNSVSISTNWETDDTFTIKFNVNELIAAPAFAAGINLDYNTKDFKYISYEQGNYFTQAGEPVKQKNPLYLVGDRPIRDANGEVTESTRLFVTITLFKGTPGIQGSGHLITLKFKASNKNPKGIFFSKKTLFGLDAKEIENITWPSSIPTQPV